MLCSLFFLDHDNIPPLLDRMLYSPVFRWIVLLLPPAFQVKNISSCIESWHFSVARLFVVYNRNRIVAFQSDILTLLRGYVVLGLFLLWLPDSPTASCCEPATRREIQKAMGFAGVCVGHQRVTSACVYFCS